MQKRSGKRTQKKQSWGHLGAILGRFGSPLGLGNLVFSLVFKAFREHSLFSNNIVSRTVLNRTWSPKPPKMTSQNDPKANTKNKNEHNTEIRAKNMPKMQNTWAASERKALLGTLGLCSARPSLSFRSLFGRLLRSARPSSSFRSFFGRLLRL